MLIIKTKAITQPEDTPPTVPKDINNTGRILQLRKKLSDRRRAEFDLKDVAQIRALASHRPWALRKTHESSGKE